jgi:hypothetical protein
MQRKVGQDMVIKKKTNTAGNFTAQQHNKQETVSHQHNVKTTQLIQSSQRSLPESTLQYQKKQSRNLELTNTNIKKNKPSIITRLFRKFSFKRLINLPDKNKQFSIQKQSTIQSQLDDTTFKNIRPIRSPLPPARGRMLWFFSAVALIILITTIFSLIARATIEITLRESQYTVDSNTVFYQEPSPDQIGFKTATMTDTESITVQTTNRDNSGSNAHGTVRLFSTGTHNINIPAKTQLTSTTTGKKFITISAVIITAGSVANPATIEVPISAVEPGEQSNIGRDDFTLEKFPTISARSLDDISGGSSKGKFVLTNDQLQTTQQQLIDRMKLRDPSVFLSKQIPEDFLLLNSLTQTDDFVFTQQSVENGVSVTATRVITGNMIRRDDLYRYLETVTIPESDQLFMSIVDISKIKVTVQPSLLKQVTGTLSIHITGTVTARAKFDKSTLLPTVADHKKKEVKQTLINTPGIVGIHISVWPPWISRVPNRVSRINFVTTFQQTQ